MLKQLLTPFLNHKYLLLQLTMRDIKARYKQSVIGYAWVIINPLAQLLVYTFVFSVLFKFSLGDTPYPLFLFAGLLPWIFFQTSLTASTNTLVDNSNLLKKVYFPREIFIYSIILSKLVDFLFAISLLVIFIVFYRIPIDVSALLVLPLLLLQIILTTGLSMIFATFNLFYRDIQYLINLLLLLWMYLTPIVYTLDLVPKKYMLLYKLNPMVGIIEGYRAALFGIEFDMSIFTWSLAISILTFIIGFFVFKRSEKVFADIV